MHDSAQSGSLDYAIRLGYEEAAARIQDLYLDGKKLEALAAVPDSLVDEVALVGPKARIVERLSDWKPFVKVAAIRIWLKPIFNTDAIC